MGKIPLDIKLLWLIGIRTREYAPYCPGAPDISSLLLIHYTEPSNLDRDQGNEVLAYSLVVLGPERALQPAAKNFLKDTALNNSLAMFAIDDMHMISHWRGFRTDLALLYILRTSSVVPPLWISLIGISPSPILASTAPDSRSSERLLIAQRSRLSSGPCLEATLETINVFDS